MTDSRTRVFLHVGSPKTGTTFLQNVLWAHRATAADQGLLLPGERFFDHYLASLDARDLADKPQHPPRAVGMWERLVTESLAWPDTVLISHELFAAASSAEARRAVASFGDAEVHVVVTARDLVRQMTAEWQEHVKHRSTTTFGDFVQELRADASGRSWFWKVQDFAGVLKRWGGGLPPDRVHVVTVPPAGAPADLLWSRFAGLLGLDAATFDLQASRSNTSLGAEQAELLRRVNTELGDRVPLPGPYSEIGKNLLAQRILASRTGSRLTLTPEDTDFALTRSAAVAGALDQAGYDVVGSLEELVPSAEDAAAVASPDAYAAPDDARLLEESVVAIAGLMHALADRRAQRRYEELARTLREKPFRFAVVQAAERHRTLGRVHAAYRRGKAVARHLKRSD